MSEKETLKAMFARVGIGYTDESSADCLDGGSRV